MKIENSQDRYIPSLDGWRAIAIIAVMICHGITPMIANARLHALFSLGAFGVHIFFCISGFLITSRLIAEYENKKKISFKNFYIRRFFRIIPPAFTYILVIFILQTAGLFQVEWKSYLGSLFFFKNFAADKSWYLSHFWSLSVEEQFYIAWPLFLFALTIKNGLKIALFLFLLTAFYSLKYSDTSYQYIVAGCLFAFIIQKSNWQFFIQKLSTYYVQVGLAFLFFLGILNKIPFREIYLPIVITLLVISTVTNPNCKLSRVLENFWLKKIGTYSYSIYLWQQLFLILEPKYIFASQIQNFPVNFILVLVCAFLSHQLIEKPLIKMGRKLTVTRD